MRRSLTCRQPPPGRGGAPERSGPGVRLCCRLHHFTADSAHPDVPLREMQIAHVVELGRLAADLGAPVVRIFTGYESPDLPHANAWKWCVDAHRRGRRPGAELGVTLGVQNHHDVAAGLRRWRVHRRRGSPNCRLPSTPGPRASRRRSRHRGAGHGPADSPYHRGRLREAAALRLSGSARELVAQPPAVQAVAMGDASLTTAASWARWPGAGTPASLPTRCARPCRGVAAWRPGPLRPRSSTHGRHREAPSPPFAPSSPEITMSADTSRTRLCWSPACVAPRAPGWAGTCWSRRGASHRRGLRTGAPDLVLQCLRPGRRSRVTVYRQDVRDAETLTRCAGTSMFEGSPDLAAWRSSASAWRDLWTPTRPTPWAPPPSWRPCAARHRALLVRDHRQGVP